MVTTQQVMAKLIGKQNVGELEKYLEEHFESFSEVRRRYVSAAEQLRDELGADASPSVDDLMDAIARQTASNLFFSWILGIKSNLDHFMDPMAGTVLNVNFDVFLREDIARRLPIYEEAQGVLGAFCASLEPRQKEMLGDVFEYIAYLETCGPKLAHYFGFLLGDELLPNLVLGYAPDQILTMQYKAMLDHYMGSHN